MQLITLSKSVQASITLLQVFYGLPAEVAVPPLAPLQLHIHITQRITLMRRTVVPDLQNDSASLLSMQAE